MDNYSRCAARIQLFATQGNQLIQCGLGTGFFFRHNQELFLITNWHILTGVDPTTMCPVGGDPQLPDTLLVECKRATNKDGEFVQWGAPERAGFINTMQPIYLYNATSPVWFEHSTRQNVDVVALNVSSFAALPGFSNIAVNEVDQSPNLQPAPGMDCFVLGFPEAMVGPGATPIWKRGSIASEPGFNFRNMPAFLIDTATRSGMSGSAVVARHSGILKSSPGPGISDGDLIGTMTRFIGIYSGRIGEDVLGVQLGIVWRSDVLDDILSLDTQGTNPFK